MKKNKKTAPYHEPEVEETELEEALDETPEDTVGEELESDVDLELLQAENQKLREDYLRAFADAENTKKRCAQEIEKNHKYAISSFAKSLLSVADNLHRAIDAVSKDESPEQCAALLKGVELTENELMNVFKKFGITRMEIMGTVFDPNFHQVVQEVEDKSKPAGLSLIHI